jgi:hypothetical protein
MPLPYPITIFKTRYSGNIEGAEWAAFNRDPDDISPHATGDDPVAARWWSERDEPYGLGDTPELALADLLAQLNGQPRLHQPDTDGQDDEPTDGRPATARPVNNAVGPGLQFE